MTMRNSVAIDISDVTRFDISVLEHIDLKRLFWLWDTLHNECRYTLLFNCNAIKVNSII